MYHNRCCKFTIKLGKSLMTVFFYFLPNPEKYFLAGQRFDGYITDSLLKENCILPRSR